MQWCREKEITKKSLWFQIHLWYMADPLCWFNVVPDLGLEYLNLCCIYKFTSSSWASTFSKLTYFFQLFDFAFIFINFFRKKFPGENWLTLVLNLKQAYASWTITTCKLRYFQRLNCSGYRNNYYLLYKLGTIASQSTAASAIVKQHKRHSKETITAQS